MSSDHKPVRAVFEVLPVPPVPPPPSLASLERLQHPSEYAQQLMHTGHFPKLRRHSSGYIGRLSMGELFESMQVSKPVQNDAETEPICVCFSHLVASGLDGNGYSNGAFVKFLPQSTDCMFLGFQSASTASWRVRSATGIEFPVGAAVKRPSISSRLSGRIPSIKRYPSERQEAERKFVVPRTAAAPLGKIDDASGCGDTQWHDEVRSRESTS